MGRLAPLFLLLALSALAQEDKSDRAEVRRFFPERLIGQFSDRQFDFVAVDFDAAGRKNYLVAAYSDGTDNAVAVLRKSEAGVSLLSWANLPKLWGGRPELEALDLDGDGKPEIVLTLQTRGLDTWEWLLKFDGTTLRSIGPMDDDGDTLLTNSSVLDIDGDGLLEAASPGPIGDIERFNDDPPAERRGSIFRLKGASYSNVGSPMFLRCLLTGDTRYPAAYSTKFTVNAPGPGFRLIVFNGISGSPRAPRGSIKLNGIEVVGPQKLNKDTARLTALVSVVSTNTIEADLGGERLAAILVLVLPE